MNVPVDGRFVPPEEANVPIPSHVFGRGSAISEAMDVVAATEGQAGAGYAQAGRPRKARFLLAGADNARVESRT